MEGKQRRKEGERAECWKKERKRMGLEGLSVTKKATESI
jgi:hypothetical protein